MTSEGLFDLFVQLDIAIQKELGPHTYNSDVEKAFRHLAKACGVDAREVGEATFSRTGGGQC